MNGGKLGTKGYQCVTNLTMASPAQGRCRVRKKRLASEVNGVE